MSLCPGCLSDQCVCDYLKARDRDRDPKIRLVSYKMAGRKKPYTDAEIKRLKCIRCGSPACATRNICADAGLYRPVCKACDHIWTRYFTDEVSENDGPLRPIEPGDITSFSFCEKCHRVCFSHGGFGEDHIPITCEELE